MDDPPDPPHVALIREALSAAIKIVLAEKKKADLASKSVNPPPRRWYEISDSISPEMAK